MLKFIKNIFSGFALGTAEIIPGVSGGTIALMLGCYDELLGSINHFRKQWRKSLLFLIPLLIGMGAALLLLSSVVKYLLEYYSFQTMLFFVGLICGIIPILYTRVKEDGHLFKLKLKTIALALMPLALMVALSVLELKVISGTDYAQIVQDMGLPLMLYILFAGILASCALVIPGVSGSFVLLTLGLYPLVIHSVSEIGGLLRDITNTSLLLSICKVLLPFGIGVIIGGLSMVRLMEKLLKDYRKEVYSVILGLLTGSVYAIMTGPAFMHSGITGGFPIIIAGFDPALVTVIAVATGVVTFSSGAAISFMLGRKKL